MQTNVSPTTDDFILNSINQSRWSGRIPITITLAAAIGALVLATAVIVFSVGVWLARKNTFDLLSANSQQAIETDVRQIEQYLRPAEIQTQFFVEKIIKGEVDLTDRKELGAMFVGALSAAPQIEAIMFVDVDLQNYYVSRNTLTGEIDKSIVDLSQDPMIREYIALVQQGAVWVPPLWESDTSDTYLSRAHPVYVDDEYQGAVVSIIGSAYLSEFISESGPDSSGHNFILYGRDYVLAHWLMVDGYPGLSSKDPLPHLSRFSDPILASIWQEHERHDLPLKFNEGVEAHLLGIFDDEYAFIYKTVTGFGEVPFIVGTYFQASDLPDEIKRFFAALIAGLVALLVSLIAAVLLGRRIAQPIVQFSTAAIRIKELDVSKVQALPSSIFYELNEQSLAFNSMLRALRWFEQYVPKKIVKHLIRHGDIQETSSDSQDVTVLFTDVAGFSLISEGMTAPEVAAFVNHHFSLVVHCIEAEGGTVDKFMGDAVMAFWSGDDELQANSACRTALAISKAIMHDNQRRRAQALPDVRVRMGVHTGVATVGNIGAPGRLNYTVIGDTVNVGQRLEQLGKELCPAGSEVTILISGDTAIQLDPSFEPIAAGSFKLKGRVGEVDVFKL